MRALRRRLSTERDLGHSVQPDKIAVTRCGIVSVFRWTDRFYRCLIGPGLDQQIGSQILAIAVLGARTITLPIKGNSLADDGIAPPGPDLIGGADVEGALKMKQREIGADIGQSAKEINGLDGDRLTVP